LHWAGERQEAAALLSSIEQRAGGDPRILFTLGLTCARLGLYERAENAFSAVAKEFPGEFDVLMNLGRAASRAGRHERARQVLEAALKVRPGDVEALYELGLVHSALQDPSRAVFVLAQARKKAPKQPDILLALASAAEEAGYYGDSAMALDEYLALRPNDHEARRNRGRVCARTETRKQEGLEELRWYVEKYPDDARGHYDLARLIWEESPDEALDELAAALRLQPDFADAHLARGWLLQRSGRSEEAVPHLEAAVKLHPKSIRALDQLGLAYFTLDRAAEAEKVLRKALALAPEDPEVLLHMGRTLMALEKPEEAQEFMAKFRNVRPPQGRDQGTEARMIELASLPPAERRKREIERFREWSESRPDEAEFHLHLATLLLADGQTEEAVREFHALYEKNSNAEVREKAGRALLGVQEYALARKFLEQAVAERPAARLDLAVAVLFTDGPDQALEVMGKAPDGEDAGDYLLMKARILDAAGRAEESDRVLREGLQFSATQPEIARQAALLLLRHENHEDALGLLDKAIAASPDHPGLSLMKANVLGVAGRSDEALAVLQAIERRWPEWDRGYLIHGLLLEERGETSEARQKIRTAIALGADNLAARCSLARLDGSDAPEASCECVKGLREQLIPACEAY
jgi:tetratricopeptide (TPR) repeat protein